MDSEVFGMSVEDAAVRAGIGRSMIFVAIRDGKLKARKFGRRTIILNEDLVDFVRNLPVREAA